jgi:hypothetical protein
MRIEKLPSSVFTSLDDGRGVLLNLDTLLYYSLNRTGAEIWRQIEPAGADFGELVRGVCRAYDLAEADAKRHLGDFIERLERFKLVRIH